MPAAHVFPRHELSPVTPTIIVTPSAPSTHEDSLGDEYNLRSTYNTASSQGSPVSRRQSVYLDQSQYTSSRPLVPLPSPTDPVDWMSEISAAMQMSPLAIGGWGREWERSFAHRLPITYPAPPSSDAEPCIAVDTEDEEAEADLLADLKGFPMPPVRLGLLTPPQSPEDVLLPRPLNDPSPAQEGFSKNSMWRWSASDNVEPGDVEEMTDEDIDEDEDEDDARTITASTPTSQGSRWSAPESPEVSRARCGRYRTFSSSAESAGNVRETRRTDASRHAEGCIPRRLKHAEPRVELMSRNEAWTRSH